MTHPTLPPNTLRTVHHIALNVKDMQASCHFYGTVLGLHQLSGEEIPSTLKDLVASGKVTNFKTPDGLILDLFWEPDLSPPNPDPTQQFTRANHLAFDIHPESFDRAVAILKANHIPIDAGPVSRPTGRGIYCFDPDGFMIEIRCDRIDEIYHITTAPAWQQAQASGTYRAPSLDTEGFIHCSTREKILWVANQFYRDQPDLVLLCIDPQKITAPWQFDPVPEVGNFPHIYGDLNCTAIVRVLPFQAQPNGEFTCPETT